MNTDDREKLEWAQKWLEVLRSEWGGKLDEQTRLLKNIHTALAVIEVIVIIAGLLAACNVALAVFG